MGRIGWHASHEIIGPDKLLRQAQRAESAGFAAGMCSGHFHPWTPQQGESGFSFAWLGAALQATGLTFGNVCAPGQRYHPAIVAQATATLAVMFPDRYWVAFGTGQNLNESITGDRWPDKKTRRARLLECVQIIRDLWAGETVTHKGLVSVQQATLYTRPATPPSMLATAITPETAKWVGSWADGLITVGTEHDALRDNLEAFREGGGEGKPAFLQSSICYGTSKSDARQKAYRAWPVAGLMPDELQDAETPEALARMVAVKVRPNDLDDRLRLSGDINEYIDWHAADLELGFDRVYVYDVSGEPERFIDAYGSHVLPALAKEKRFVES